MSRVYVGIGSNLGDRAGHIERARGNLSAMPRSRLIGFSPVIETDPIGPPGQNRYLNAAAAIDSEATPIELLAYLMDIERCEGRQRRQRWAARTLDLDILLYDDLILSLPELVVPHPHMHRRRFVLEPLCRIAPDAIHPQFNKTVAELLDGLNDQPSTG